MDRKPTDDVDRKPVAGRQKLVRPAASMPALPRRVANEDGDYPHGRRPCENAGGVRVPAAGHHRFALGKAMSSFDVGDRRPAAGASEAAGSQPHGRDETPRP